MKKMSLFFVFALTFSMATVSGAADSYKANLSGASLAPVASIATGEAKFELSLTGSGAGGFGPPVDTRSIKPGTEGPAPWIGPDHPDYRGGPAYEDSGAGAGGPGTETLSYKLDVKNIKDVTAAHLHLGKGTSAIEGPVIAPLFLGPKKGGGFEGTLAEGRLMDKDLQGPLAGMKIADLIREIDRGNVYVNVHTEQHPAGEIRGQVKEG